MCWTVQPVAVAGSRRASDGHLPVPLGSVRLRQVDGPSGGGGGSRRSDSGLLAAATALRLRRQLAKVRISPAPTMSALRRTNVP